MSDNRGFGAADHAARLLDDVRLAAHLKLEDFEDVPGSTGQSPNYEKVWRRLCCMLFQPADCAPVVDADEA